MGLNAAEEDPQSTPLLLHHQSPPKDYLHLSYITHFILGLGFLLPWNVFITAVDYFSYLYPSSSIDRTFSVSYMISCLIPLILIIYFGAHKARSELRINSGLVLFTLCLVVIPVMDLSFVKGRPGLYVGYDVTVGSVVLAGVADALVQGGVIGAAGELPERYMQAVVAGTAASGVLVSAMRVITKAIYPQNAEGLRKSANLYFAVSIAVMAICLVCYNIADRLPVVQYYKEIKRQALEEEKKSKNSLTGSAWRSTLWNIVLRTKWHGFGIFIIYVVTLSIFPGYITEDVHSKILKDWYPILLIAGYNVFDLIGKVVPSIYLIEDASVAVFASVGRLLFYPLFLGCLHGPEFFRTEIPVTVLTCVLGLTNGYFTAVLMIHAPKTVPIQHSETVGIVMVLFLGCLHGPEFFRTEIPVTVLTCVLGLTNGYFTAVLMIHAPKTVPIQHSETVGIVMVLFLVVGLAVGSVVSWFWVI